MGTDEGHQARGSSHPWVPTSKRGERRGERFRQGMTSFLDLDIASLAGTVAGEVHSVEIRDRACRWGNDYGGDRETMLCAYFSSAYFFRASGMEEYEGTMNEIRSLILICGWGR